MAIELINETLPLVDEKFSQESKLSLVTNQFFDFDGKHGVKVYKVTTSPMTDYDRTGKNDTTQKSRYGKVGTLDANTNTYEMKNDRSFTYVLDLLDIDETKLALEATSSLGRQTREVIIPEIDSYVFNVMAKDAGTKAAAIKLTEENIYEEILKANNALDNAMVPDTPRYIIVTPDTYTLIKRNKDFLMSTDLGQDIKVKGVVASIDGLNVIKVPSSRLPKDFGFLVCHPVATVAPVKLLQFRVHDNPPGVSGQLVEGRLVYDAYVLENKNKAIYYQPNSAE